MTVKYTYDHPRPMVTVDMVVVSREKNPRVLLVRRKHDPFAGRWALPGGFVEMNETLEEAARRELYEETGVKAGPIEQLYTFGDPGRDPRGRVIRVVYLAQVNAGRVAPRGADDAAEAGWHSLRKPPPSAFDHADILACARKQLKEGSRQASTKAPRCRAK